MKKRIKGFGDVILALTLLSVILLLVAGWVMNIVDLATENGDMSLGMIILRGIGVFVPFLGGVLGWF